MSDSFGKIRAGMRPDQSPADTLRVPEDDLVRRLRARFVYVPAPNKCVPISDPDCAEAADRIEALTRTLAETEKLLRDVQEESIAHAMKATELETTLADKDKRIGVLRRALHDVAETNHDSQTWQFVNAIAALKDNKGAS